LTEDLVGKTLREEGDLEDVADWRIILKCILIGIGWGGGGLDMDSEGKNGRLL